jgi:type IV secretory pathway VirB10-like protein
LSSILNALKKAERESGAGADAKSSLPAALPEPSPYTPGKRSWWLPVGILGAVCIGAVLFWIMQRPSVLPPESPREPAAPPRTETKNSPPAKTAAATRKPEIHQENMHLTAARSTDPGPAKSYATKPAPTIPAKTPVAKIKPPPPPTRRRNPTIPPSAAAEQSRAVSPEHSSQKTLPTNDAAKAADQRRASRETVVDPLPSPPQPKAKTSKIYRSDPRIELQALVWSPEPAARFVIINNRLIKEGGSLEGITVRQIDQDDVLLSEGANQWHERFNIR